MAKQWHQLEKLDHKSLKKLQLDREKQAQQQKQEADRKRIAIIIGSVLLAIICAVVFLMILRNRSAQKAYQEEREKMYKVAVTDVKGSVQGRSIGDWEKVPPGFSFDDEYTFKVEKDGALAVKLQLENVVKLASMSEMTVMKATLHETENRVVRESVSLSRGELTVAISLDGRDLLEIESGGIVAKGASGLFKVLYNQTKGSGEVVVKNGLVEVYSKKNPSKRVKVSGFYKVVFDLNQLGNPTQASVIQYDWR
ncbi:MAG TPA: hypothetical protein VIV61_00400 [Candidatus Ozemobacteraceae bacterium]